MYTRVGRLVVALFSSALLLGAGVAPVRSAENLTPNLGSFQGSAGSRAVHISIGDLALTVGGGESSASYTRVANDPAQIPDSAAEASARGIVIPGVFSSEVSCIPPKLTDELTALTTPESLEPLLSAKIALARCAVSMEDLPTAEHSAGEVVVDIKLVKALVESVPLVNDLLDSLLGQLDVLPLDVRNEAGGVINAILDRLTSAPVLKLRVAPNSGSVKSTGSGIDSLSSGTAVTIDVLGGVLQIEIATAEAKASIADGKPEGSADVTFVRVKALNILSSNQKEALINQKIAAPEQDIVLLEGTPLEIRIMTERGVTSQSCEGELEGFDVCSTALADGVALFLLSDPLPTVGVELVHTEAQAAGLFAAAAPPPEIGRPGPPAQPALPPRPRLPVTGAGAAGAVLSGLAIAFGGLAARRRLNR